MECDMIITFYQIQFYQLTLLQRSQMIISYPLVPKVTKTSLRSHTMSLQNNSLQTWRSKISLHTSSIKMIKALAIAHVLRQADIVLYHLRHLGYNPAYVHISSFSIITMNNNQHRQNSPLDRSQQRKFLVHSYRQQQLNSLMEQ